MRYTFGTSGTAAERLRSIARFFNPLSAEFVRAHAPRRVSAAVDLGCGPGFSTEMLAEALPDATVVGLDRSEEFLTMARARRPDLRFVERDITVTPFPVAADVAYCRFLLSHLDAPVGRVDHWADALRTGGRLLVEETERIDTEVPAFRRYVEISAAMIQAQGAELLVGDTLAKGGYRHTVVLNSAFEVSVPNPVVASWFLPNAATLWAQNDYVLRSVATFERATIREELARIRSSGGEQGSATWHIRRLVLEASG